MLRCNGQAVFVERAYGKAIMSSFHAVFSIGMALGAGCGALFAKFEVALLDHLTLVAILGGIACLAAAFYLIDDTPEEDGKKKKGGGFVLPTKAIFAIGYSCILLHVRGRSDGRLVSYLFE